MLMKLYIRNYAIIREVEVDFGNHLNIITGETGAGKSILMGALSLILGERADASVLMHHKGKCVIEGVFRLQDEKVAAWMQQHEMDEGEEMIIRRELLTGGKSRSFVNDTPVNLNMLKELGSLLVDQHQQFDGQGIATESFQRSVLDALAGNAALLQQLQEEFHLLTETRTRYDALLAAQATAEKERDYHSYLLQELESVDLKEQELELLDAELNTLSNAGHIQQVLTGAVTAMSDGEQPLVQQLKSLQQKLQQLESVFPGVSPLCARLKSAAIEVEDIAGDMERLSDSVSYQPERMEWLNERIGIGYKLLKKHGVQSTDELLNIQADLRGKLALLDQSSDNLQQLKADIVVQEKQAVQTAARISKNRQQCVASFEKNVNQLLKRVGMPNARLKVAVEPGTLRVHGTDSIRFLFNANVGTGAVEAGFEPLGKVASGGELSRLMLSIKSLVAGKLQLPTLVFDEIDTGISGEAARQVAMVMEEMSHAHQLIAITHQPQIAARAQKHFFVFKSMQGEVVEAGIRVLGPDERIKAIAQMLSGEQPSAAALENAREMMNT